MSRLRPIFAAAALALLAACSKGYEAPPVDTSVYGAGDDWDNPGGDWAGSHFSRLGDITKENAGQLGLAWEYDLGSKRVQEATPVVIDGVMYTSGNLGKVYALDATDGKELWTFAPQVDMQVNRSACCDQANRGVAVADGKVFVGALDGQLYALDAKTGAIAWQADTITDRQRGYTITGAPEVAGDLVIIGNAGAEYDARGYVTAYDVRTAKRHGASSPFRTIRRKAPRRAKRWKPRSRPGIRRAAGISAAAVRCGMRSPTIRSSTRC